MEVPSISKLCSELHAAAQSLVAVRLRIFLGLLKDSPFLVRLTVDACKPSNTNPNAMKNQFHTHLSLRFQSITVMLLGFGIIASGWPAFATDFRRGPIIDISDPDFLTDCGSNGAEKESSIVVNPQNPKNIVVAWIGGAGKAIGTAVSFDGGKRWQLGLIPGLTECGAGVFDGNSDPWLSFAPNGTLHFVC